MSKFANYFGIKKSQAELDFVNVDLDEDTPLYIDPYALTTREDEWSIKCHGLVVSYFEEVLKAIQESNFRRGKLLLSHLNEPEETKLGVSLPGNKGRGIGQQQAEEIFTSLKNSKAATSGLLEDLSDFALFIPQIGRDKISDMTTNIIRLPLIKYTQKQCELYDIPMRDVPSGFYWCDVKKDWLQGYEKLPICNNDKIILVPKFAVRYHVGVDHSVYRSKFVLEFLRESHDRPGDALLTAIKDKKGKVIRETVFKKDVDKHYPKHKDFLAEFTAAHQDVIDKYKDYLKESTSKVPNISGGTVNERDLSEYLSSELDKISPGIKDAGSYHSLVLGIISFLFFPNLIYPQKEAEVNEGRKRIDILYTNGKNDGFFYRVALDADIKANFVTVECKNYNKDIANAELDQLLGRFDHHRGKLGMLLFRATDNRDLLIKRCKDGVRSGQGLILPMDDIFIKKCLKHVSDMNRYLIDSELATLYAEVST